jgi:ATP-dependent Clp protease ATP-binding subunit ClpC
MFERYNEKARRTIFFARYEASQFDSPEIQSEHLLLGILREGRSALNAILGLQNREDEIRAAIAESSKPQGKKATSVDLPLTDECKRILAYGAEEAERLDNNHIGIEHLLLGILREEKCLAARILHERGLSLKKARTLIETAKVELASGKQSVSWELGPRAASSIRVVDAKTLEVVLSALPRGAGIPRIGEAIRIRDSDNAVQSYRVQDVVRELELDHGNPGTSVLKEVKLLVVREDSV